MVIGLRAHKRCRGYDKDGYKYAPRHLLSFSSYCYDFDGSGTGTMENALRNYDPAFFNTVEGEMCLAVRDFNQGSALDLVSVANERQSEVREPRGPELVFRDGYNTLTGNLTAQFLAAGGTGVTNAVVTEVKYCEGFSEGGAMPECQAQVTTTSGSYTADAVIVAVPLGVLQAGSVTFSPALPAEYTAAINRMQFGVVNKAVAVFPNDFWSAGCGNELMVAINQRGANIDNRGMFPYFMNTNKVWPGTNALMGFAVGRYAIASESKTDAEVQADFMSRLRQQYPNAPEPTSFIRSKWQSDPYAKGSYTTPSGINAQNNELRTLGEAVSASLSLAGEHTHPTWAATVHGAFLSGERAADDIMNGMPSQQNSQQSATASCTAWSLLSILLLSMF